MTRTTATRWAYGFLIAGLLLAAAPGRVAKAQPPGYPIGGVGSHGWIDGFGMFTRTVWNGRTPVVQITGITPGAPAARFGLEVGDCIVRVSSYQTTTLTVLGKTSGTPSPDRSTIQAASLDPG